MTITNLRNHASAQCCVRHYDNGDLCLQSYMTDVVYYDFSRGMLYCTGAYSQTTRKHISWFLHEYFPSFTYQELRDAYNCACKLSEVLIGRRVRLSEYELRIMEAAHNGRQLNPDCFKEVI